MNMKFLCVLMGVVSFFAAGSIALAAGRSAIQRDVESYAIAVCFASQEDQPYLKDQGYAWAEVIVQGRGRGPESLEPLRAAVKKVLAKGHVPVGFDEAHPMEGKALPVLYCGEIIDNPTVRAAITEVVAKIAKSR
ncbi:hypothetical protein UCD39_03735 [Nitrospirillum sp. BR 11752]|uniref:hypothetical protein n=1 Tax=Nitrospirillum sp. BR 11752 TaxID=3104293 RepID=UPI002EB5F763|nr:hypothetical protein [Nitrospirillum sp. BR 11752]